MGGRVETRFATLGARGIRIVIFWLTVILVVAVDQATKAAMLVKLQDGPKPFIPGVLDLVLVHNTGAAFSFGEGGGIFFVLVALVFLVGSVFVVWNEPDLPVSLVIPIGLVAGGGTGNMIDRLMEGSVIDFLSTSFMNFPVFNVADICVTVGIALVIIGYLRWDRMRESDSASQNKSVSRGGFGHV
ncbi:MAG: signal peptidase II [Atopobiaceae bacterium]|nr:signal peptidase II [Atopobiaceae bacterium]